MEVSESHRRIPVTEPSQPSAARYAAQDAARAAAFPPADIHRAGLVATELATNLVKHAAGGELLVCRTSCGAGVEIIAIDRGPGIPDPARALLDGHSTAGSPGTGFGAIRRLSDDFDVYSQRDRGTIVLARLQAGRPRPVARARLVVAGLSVARDGEAACGDAWQVRLTPAGALIVLADGLGHGVQAREAAAAAVASVEGDGGDLAQQLERMHLALRHTRGAAAALAAVNPELRVVRFAGVGNVTGAVVRHGASRQAVSLNGTLGHAARSFREYAYPWERDATLVMHTDGLGSRWSLDEYPGLWLRHPAIAAAVLYRDYGRGRDDVAVVVGREAL